MEKEIPKVRFKLEESSCDEKICFNVNVGHLPEAMALRTSSLFASCRHTACRCIHADDKTVLSHCVYAEEQCCECVPEYSDRVML